MKKILTLSALSLLTLLTTCRKENVSANPGSPGNDNPNPTDSARVHTIKVQAVIKIGDVLYDSIPASVQLISWDSSDAVYQQQLQLAAGTNSVNLPKSHVRYQLQLNKWGITDEITFTKTDRPQGSLIRLGGSQGAKKLQREETSVLILGAYEPNSKIVYLYNADGSIKQANYFEKKPRQQDLSLSYFDIMENEGARVGRINRFDENNNLVGSTSFTYSGESRVVNMHQTSYDKESIAVVSYGAAPGFNTVDIDYAFDNGNAVSYSMKFKGENMIEDESTSSTGAGGHGFYTYDFNINPYIHLNMPDFFLSKMSKNNLLVQQKTYSGSLPSAEPYKFEYTYDAEGYPIQLYKSYKSYATGEHLYKTRTIYTY
jgi:hypothetical protein